MEFKTGDIFCDANGFCGDREGGQYIVVSMFEYDEKGDSGEGFTYSGSGERCGYYWAHPGKEKLVTNIPDDILYSFRHGSRDFKILESEFKRLNDWIEVIKKSDFKYVTRGDVQISSIIESVVSIDDVKDHWVIIRKYGVTPKIAEMCLESIGGKIPPVHNGEIGMHAMDMIFYFHKYFDHIETSLLK